MKDQDNINKLVEIDENALDKECIRLPSYYLQASHQSSQAKRDVAELESALKVREADITQLIRTNPEKYGIAKVTEAAISSVVLTRKSYKELVAQLQNARYQADLAQGLVWALEHKKRSLTLLVELLGLSYFSSPKISEEGRRAVEKMTQSKVRRHREED